MKDNTAPDRADVIARYKTVRGLTEKLAAPLSAEDQTVQTMLDVSPTKWHRAHVTWFFETFILKAYADGYTPFHEDYEFLFNSYYNGVGEQFHRPSRGLLSRPGIEDIARYRAHVDAAMIAFIEAADDKTWESVDYLFALGLNHEQQHQELLLTDIKHVLGFNPLHPAYREDLKTNGKVPGPMRFIGFEGGMTTIGHQGNGFAFDNEGPRHEVYIAPFAIASRPVTNAEFFEFIEDGGYEKFDLWLSDGWATVQENGWRHPIYWRQKDGEWFEFTLGGLRPLDMKAPASHLSFYEADAFARWAGKRLPGEEEWEVAAGTLSLDGNFVDDDALHPQGDDGNGLVQMFGDVWEWTQSSYAPYRGFTPAEGAVGEYNGKFMANQMVLRGGSCATSQDHIRPTYRNFFYPKDRWQFSGVRLAEDA